MLVAVIVAPIAATILQLAVSRQREYLADATAAQYLGEGRPLAEALETLERGVEAVPMNVNPATEALYIANPLSKQRHLGALLDAPADGGADPPPARARRGERYPLLGRCAGGGSGGGSSGLSGSRRRSRPPASRPIEAAALVPVGPPRRPLGSGGVALELPEEPRGRRRPRTGVGLGVDRSARGEVVAVAALRRRPSTARSTSRSRGRSGSCPSASGRSTSTGCIRISASSSRSSSRRCSSATSGPAAACSTRSPARGRRSCSRSSRATTPSGVDIAAFNAC